MPSDLLKRVVSVCTTSFNVAMPSGKSVSSTSSASIRYMFFVDVAVNLLTARLAAAELPILSQKVPSSFTAVARQLRFTPCNLLMRRSQVFQSRGATLIFVAHVLKLRFLFLCKASQGKARGKRRRGEARQGEGRQVKARQGKLRQGKARQGKARQGEARRGKATKGRARQGPARQGKARQRKAGQGKIKLGEGKQGNARQDAARQRRARDAVQDERHKEITSCGILRNSIYLVC